MPTLPKILRPGTGNTLIFLFGPILPLLNVKIRHDQVIQIGPVQKKSCKRKIDFENILQRKI